MEERNTTNQSSKPSGELSITIQLRTRACVRTTGRTFSRSPESSSCSTCFTAASNAGPDRGPLAAAEA